MTDTCNNNNVQAYGDDIDTTETGYNYTPTQQERLLRNSPHERHRMASMSRDFEYGADDDDDNGDGEHGKCGWGRFTPKCLQVLLNIKAYLIVFTLASLVQIMTSYGLVTIAITTIERRFYLSSFKSGTIMSAYQFATMAFTVFVTYVGEKRHKPRWIGAGSLFLCVGSVIFTLPHFLSGDYEYGDYSDSNDVCLAPNGTDQFGDMCSTDNSSAIKQNEDVSKYYWLFIVAQMFNSLAAAPLFTLGVTYMDDNLVTKDFGLYMGIYNALLSFGPALGYFIGVLTLSLYTDFSRDPASITITPDNPMWIGAWWLGFLINAGVIAIASFFIMAFPKFLPGNEKITKKRKNQAQRGSEFVTRPGFRNSVKDFPRALIKIFSNLPFVCVSITAVTEWFVGAGIFIFAPKFLESQLNINARDVGKYVGVMAMTSHFLAALVSGALMKRLDLKFPGLMKMCMVSIVLSLIAGLAYIMHCPNTSLAGVSVHYMNISLPISDNEVGLLAECNSHCACESSFEPVCGEDNIMYYSPCHAGCTVEDFTDGTVIYSECRCIVSANETADVTTNSWEKPLQYGRAVPGRCGTRCSYQWIYLIALWLFSFFTTFYGIPAWVGTMRCVSHSQRAFALGVQSLLYGGLGTAPSPIIFGFIIDKACLYWDMNCSGNGSCLLYDNKKYAHSLLLIVVCFKCVSFVFIGLTLLFYKPMADDPDVDMFQDKPNPTPTTEL